jgi:hypothetical protein
VRLARSDAICRNHTLRLGSATAAVRSEVQPPKGEYHSPVKALPKGLLVCIRVHSWLSPFAVELFGCGSAALSSLVV